MTGWLSKWRLSPSTQLPLIVLLLMAVISVVLSERVLDRLSKSQEEFLQGLSSTYMDGLSASVVPAVLRDDNWEIFDTLERMSPKDIKMNLIEVIVTDGQDIILASNQPQSHPTLSRLTISFKDRFETDRAVLDDVYNLGYRVRSIFHQGKEVGKIYATFDASLFLAERKTVFYTILLTNLALTVLIASIGFYAVKRMVAPMRVLEKHFLDAARGELKLISKEEFPTGQSDATNIFHAFNNLVETELERAKLMEKLSREERLASLGRLASGMAHEINNPLGGLLNATDTLSKHGENPLSRKRSIELIRRGLLSIRDIVQATLATYRPERSNRDLNRQDFYDVALLLKPELSRKSNKLLIDIKSKSVSFDGVPAGPVRQAMLNLSLNAIVVSSNETDVIIGFVEQEKNYLLTVKDTGSGMREDPRSILEANDRNQIPDDMSGLGLWMVREICADLNAKLSVFDEPFGGTTVSILLPKLSKEAIRDAA